MKRLVLALVAVSVLAGCGANGNGSTALPAQPAGQATASLESSAPATQSSAAGSSRSALSCPSLADVKAATGFTGMTQAGVARETGVVICSYAPPGNTTPLKQMEVVVSTAKVTSAQARQDDVQQGLKVTDAPQFGPEAFTATGTSTLYGTVCVVQTKSGGATIAARASGELSLQNACAAAERVVPLFRLALG